MSFKLGYLDSLGGNISTFRSIKEDVAEGFSLDTYRGGDNDLFTNRKSNKAVVSLDLDFVTQEEYANLLSILNNRNTPHKIYLREPADNSQRIQFHNPGGSTYSSGFWHSSNQKYPTLADLITSTPFTNTEYGQFSGYSTATNHNAGGVNQYLHYYFKFNLSTFYSAFGSSFVNYINRMTLLLQDPRVYRVVSGNQQDMGYTVNFYDYLATSWVEVKRQSVTIPPSGNPNWQGAGLRAVQGFSNFNSYIENSTGTPYVSVLITCKPNRVSGDVYMEMKHIELLINGFLCVHANDINLNWRSNITIEGYAGQIKLLEI